MERDNRDEDMMLKGTKQEMPGFYFRLLRSEEKRELWNPDFELLFLLRGTGRVSYEDGEVHSLPVGSVFAINRFAAEASGSSRLDHFQRTENVQVAGQRGRPVPAG